jgi:hypothetical protein
MASIPPKIDKRTYEEIVRQTEDLVVKFTEWRPDDQRPNDAGRALIRIFGRMAKLVSDRINQVPDKNFLAFLDLIGGQLNPPEPARVLLTFSLAESSPADALVPAYTQVSAPPPEGASTEIVFETSQELTVTTAQLQAVFVHEPQQDRYSDLTLAATGQQDAAFLVFTGDRPIPHSLYITCPEIFDLPNLSTLTLAIATNTAQTATQFSQLPLIWSYWDGLQWQKIVAPNLPIPKIINNQLLLTFSNLPILSSVEIQGNSGKWLQASLNAANTISANLPTVNQITGSTAIAQSNLVPDTCLYNGIPLDLTKDFYPFSEEPQTNDTFYVLLQTDLIKPQAIVTLNVNLSYKPTNLTKLRIAWEIANGQQWEEIGAIANKVRWIENSLPIQFTENTLIQAKLQFPEQIPLPSTVNGTVGYWIRARIVEGYYGNKAEARKYPLYNDLAVLQKNATADATDATKSSKLIILDNVDGLLVGDLIRIQPNTDGFPEENKIAKIETGNKVTLTNGLLNATANLKIGTRIFRKLMITETVSPTYDPPLIKSFTINYNCTLQENALYNATNDFHTYQSQPFTTTLRSAAVQDAQSLRLNTIDGLSIGEFLTVDQVDTYQIAAIAPDTRQVWLTAKLSNNYAYGISVNRNFRPFTPTPDQEPTLYLGFDQSFNNKNVTLYAQVNPPLPDELSAETASTPPQLVWEYSSPNGWQPLGIEDETKRFSQRGLIQFIAPADFRQYDTFGQSLYWLRVRWQGGDFRVRPRLRRILTNTVWAVQASTLTEEILGQSNNEPNQTFYTSAAPVLAGQILEVQEGQIPVDVTSDRLKVLQNDLGEVEEIWVTWVEVSDFYASKTRDRHYILDHQTGRVQFGDGRFGMIPPRGRNNIRLSMYRTGGGKQGNIGAETINQLKTTVPYIAKVINLEASASGTNQEDLERLKARVPKQLRHRNRAVTLQDIEDLAYEASIDVARVKLITPDLISSRFSPLNENLWLDPKNPSITVEQALASKLGNAGVDFQLTMEQISNYAGQARLIVLPYSSDRQPTPSLALLEKVETYIRDRCAATMDLIVTGPQWQEVTVTAVIVPISRQGADLLRDKVSQRLEAFLHPLTGGNGDGWRFGRYPQESDLYSVIQAIAGIDRVDSLAIQKPSELAANFLIYSGTHSITISS